MNGEFPRVNAALASSVAGRALIFLDRAAASAWRTSAAGGAARATRRSLRAMPASRLIRTIAVAVLIAAGLQPLLISAMPATVVPALPVPAFALVAIFAGIAAWQADAIVTAWPHSFLARWIGR